MANRLAIAIFAAAFAASTIAAYAAGMPDTGTKNFVPGSDAPAYLVNGNLAVAPGSAGQSPLGTAYNEPTGPASQTSSAAPSPQPRTSRHGRFAGRRNSTRHPAAAHTRGRAFHAATTRPATTRTARTRTARTRTVSTRTVGEMSATALGRSARRARSERNTAATRRTERKPVATRRTGAARHGRASVRHVAAKSASRRG